MTFNSYFIQHVPYTITHLPAKSCLLRAGERAEYLYIVKSGAVRACFDKEGRDYTLQFFLEGDRICVYESLMRTEPSEFSIETIEATDVLVFHRDDVLSYLATNREFKEQLMPLLVDKMVNYVHLFVSMQVNSPEQRYAELLKHRPDIVQRIPLHYIASFLGITPVSLSRIRNRR